jgi:hypothetical protein
MDGRTELGWAFQVPDSRWRAVHVVDRDPETTDLGNTVQPLAGPRTAKKREKGRRGPQPGVCRALRDTALGRCLAVTRIDTGHVGLNAGTGQAASQREAPALASRKTCSLSPLPASVAISFPVPAEVETLRQSVLDWRVAKSKLSFTWQAIPVGCPGLPGQVPGQPWRRRSGDRQSRRSFSRVAVGTYIMPRQGEAACCLTVLG